MVLLLPLSLLLVASVAVEAATGPVEDGILALPSARADDAHASASLDDQLARLGPVVVQEDGRMSRVKDWSTLRAHEQAAILVTVQKRNAKRRAQLEKRTQGEL